MSLYLCPMKRLFVAIPIKPDPGLLSLLGQLQRQLSFERISWAKPENLHLTLKFLGETHTKTIPALSEELRRAIEPTAPFSISFDKTGLFGSRYDPRVIWLGSQGRSEAMDNLANRVLDACARVGFERDRQNFVPHLTLGRIKGLSDKVHFQRVMQQLPQQLIQIVPVNNIILFESILRKEGPIYVPLENFRLHLPTA